MIKNVMVTAYVTIEEKTYLSKKKNVSAYLRGLIRKDIASKRRKHAKKQQTID